MVVVDAAVVFIVAGILKTDGGSGGGISVGVDGDGIGAGVGAVGHVLEISAFCDRMDVGDNRNRKDAVFRIREQQIDSGVHITTILLLENDVALLTVGNVIVADPLPAALSGLDHFRMNQFVPTDFLQLEQRETRKQTSKRVVVCRETEWHGVSVPHGEWW